MVEDGEEGAPGEAEDGVSLVNERPDRGPVGKIEQVEMFRISDRFFPTGEQRIETVALTINERERPDELRELSWVELGETCPHVDARDVTPALVRRRRTREGAALLRLHREVAAFDE
jgi:hypothetical protein